MESNVTTASCNVSRVAIPDAARNRRPTSEATCSRVDQSKRFAGGAIKLLAGASELQRPMDATKEGRPDLLFEGLDFTADRRLGDVQFLCCTGETQMTRRDTESPKQIER
jgi:hypothetical protein